MPLFERARIEVYIPDLISPEYESLLDTFEREFTFAFGGSTIVRGLHGSYLSNLGIPLSDRINLIYTDFDALFTDDFQRIEAYSDFVRRAAYKALREEAVLVAVHRVYHSVE